MVEGAVLSLQITGGWFSEGKDSQEMEGGEGRAGTLPYRKKQSTRMQITHGRFTRQRLDPFRP